MTEQDNGGPSTPQAGSSTQTGTASPESPPVPGITRADTTIVQQNPWAPVVLSLDGGGVRGLSELFILRRIMDKIQEKINHSPAETGYTNLFAFGTNNEPLPLLPCYFFDYMVGTSTGGLVAVMLGRLRMNVDETIKVYWCLGNYVFYPRRYIRSYSSKRLRKAIVGTVKQNCGCHPNRKRCGDQELLRQFDYTESGMHDVSYREHPERANMTCKVVLVAQKKVGSSQVTHLFRSYNHCERFETDELEYNPGNLGRDQTKIWEACRATSAAPYYFRIMKIGADKFIDGGAGNNNPSNVAWNEAKWMSNLNDPHGHGKVACVVSLGCGEKEGSDLFGNQKSLFYLVKALKYGRNMITETQSADKETRNLANAAKVPYFRFTVKPVPGDHGNGGLAEVKLSELKKRSKSGWRRATRDAARSIADSLRRKSNNWEEQNGQRPQAPPSPNADARPEWYTNLQEEAQQTRKHAFKPEKYDYVTFDTIFDRTEEYLAQTGEPENVAGLIDNCATILLRYAQARQQADPERWKCFVSHPDPSHRLHIKE